MADRPAEEQICVIFIPLTDNLNRPIPPGEHLAVAQLVAAFAESCAVLPLSFGVWRDPHGVIFQEHMQLIAALVGSDAATAAFFRQLAASVVERWGQLEVLLLRLPVTRPLAASIEGGA
jgi:hypothetical protein